jgi:hypothetical protein
MRRNPVGRPIKYKPIIEALDEDTLYTPATIANFAFDRGLFKEVNAAKVRIQKQRIRIAMGRFSNIHAFPDEGDGMVSIKGQAPTPGWFGWRWKAVVVA